MKLLQRLKEALHRLFKEPDTTADDEEALMLTLLLDQETDNNH